MDDKQKTRQGIGAPITSPWQKKWGIKRRGPCGTTTVDQSINCQTTKRVSTWLKQFPASLARFLFLPNWNLEFLWTLAGLPAVAVLLAPGSARSTRRYVHWELCFSSCTFEKNDNKETFRSQMCVKIAQRWTENTFKQFPSLPAGNHNKSSTGIQHRSKNRCRPQWRITLRVVFPALLKHCCKSAAERMTKIFWEATGKEKPDLELGDKLIYSHKCKHTSVFDANETKNEHI